MSYWDTSAVVPLLVREADTALREEQLRSIAGMVTWWGTGLECMSALCRRQREGSLSEEAVGLARRRLRAIAGQWLEVHPSDVVRDRAKRLLRTHALRAADALQLASALIAVNERTEGAVFYGADGRLNEAASKEGFEIYPGTRTK